MEADSPRDNAQRQCRHPMTRKIENTEQARHFYKYTQVIRCELCDKILYQYTEVEREEDCSECEEEGRHQ